MPNLDTISKSVRPVKTLLIGHSGAGKTAMLGTLAKNYRLFIIDFDNGTDILRDPTILAPEYRKNVFIKTCTDKLVGTAFTLPVGTKTAWQKALEAMNNWTEEVDGKPQSLGGYQTWTPNDVLIIDSLSLCSEAILRHVAVVNNRQGMAFEQRHWGIAVEQQSSILDALFAETTNCNVIVTAHVVYTNDYGSADAAMTKKPEEMAQLRGFPTAVTRAFSTKVGAYFNNAVLVEKRGSGLSTKRVLSTVSAQGVDLKVSRPGQVKSEVEPDLDKLFTILRS